MDDVIVTIDENNYKSLIGKTVVVIEDYISPATRLVDNKLANPMTSAKLNTFEHVCENLTTHFGNDDNLTTDLTTVSGKTQEAERQSIAVVLLTLTECGFTEVDHDWLDKTHGKQKDGEDLKEYLDRVLKPGQFVQARSQDPYDFRMKLTNGEVFLIEAKKTQNWNIMLNDTLPYRDAGYIIFKTYKKTKRHGQRPPRIFCVTGEELIRMEVGSDEYEDVVHYQALNLCARDRFKNLNGDLTSCNRLNYTVSIKTLS